MISVMENDIYSSISLSIFTVLLRLIFDIVQYDMAASLIHLNRGGMYLDDAAGQGYFWTIIHLGVWRVIMSFLVYRIRGDLLVKEKVEISVNSVVGDGHCSLKSGKHCADWYDIVLASNG